MFGFGMIPPSEYPTGTKLWHIVDGHEVTVEREACDSLTGQTDYFLKKLIQGGSSSFWLSARELKERYTTEEPWSAQKKYAKQHGYIWVASLDDLYKKE